MVSKDYVFNNSLLATSLYLTCVCSIIDILIKSYQLLSPGILDTTCSGKNYWVVWYRGFNVPSSSYFIVCFVAGVCHSRTFVGVGKEIENSTNGGNWWWVKRKKISFLILIFEMKLFWLWKLKLATVKSKKSDVSSVSPFVRAMGRRANARNVGSFTLCGGQFAFWIQLLTLNYLLYSPTDAAQQFV